MVEDIVQSFVTAFTDPKKRVFWGYLVTALVIGFIFLKWRSTEPSSALLRQIFHKDIWWSASAKADYLVFAINKCLLVLLSPLLIGQLVVATWLFESLHSWLGYRPILGQALPDWSIMALFTFCYFLLDDFSRFYLHKLLHEVPFLWSFHKVHHSARTLTPMTVFRTHPVESLLFSLRSTMVQAVSIAGFVFFFGSRADLIMVLGATVISFVFNMLGSNLRHSHIPLRYPRALERWFISPAQHQIHHSTRPVHFDKNYGVVLACWDRYFGSLVYAQKHQQLKFGLSDTHLVGEQHLRRLYLEPFAEVGRGLLSWISSRATVR